MKLLSRILGSVRVLEVTLTAGGYTVRTWSCKPGGIPQQVDQVPESVARSIVAVTFAGHGVISKSSEATGVSARAIRCGNFRMERAGGCVLFRAA